MKKLLPLLLCAAVLLCACGAQATLSSDLSCEQILTAAKQACADAPEAENYYTDAKGNLDSETLSLFADGLFAECAEFDLVKGYAMYLCGGTDTYEIDVLKAEDEEGAKKLCALLERRVQTLRGGDKAMYDPSFNTRIQDVRVYTDGVYAILLLTAQNDAARGAIDAMK